MKLLTIVVPTYNTERYLRRCLDSVLAPGALQDIEVLVVNDGSRDRSSEIARAYAERYPETVTLIDKENGGHGSTINVGLAAATGRYFRVLDSDDWFDTPNFLRYLKTLRCCREDVVITPYTQEYVYNGTRVDYPYDYLEPDRVYRMNEIELIDDRMYFTMASSTYRTDLLRESGLQLFEKCFYVDMMFNMIPIPYVQTVRLVDCCVYRYFMGSPTQSMSQENLMRNLPNHDRVLRFLIDYYAAHRDTVHPHVRGYMGQMIFLMYFTHMDLVCVKLRDRKRAYEMFTAIERDLREKAPDLYERTNAFSYLRVTRALHYRNLRRGNTPVIMALDVAKKLAGRHA